MSLNSKREGCPRCWFWERQEPTPGDDVAYGLCRRYPPGDVGWPATTPDDWCGELSDRGYQEPIDS